MPTIFLKKKIIFYLLCVFVHFSLVESSAQVQSLTPPDWFTKAKTRQRIAEDLDVIVKVNRHDLPNPVLKNELEMSGLGLALLPRSQAFALAKDFNNLKNASDYIKEIKYDPQTKRLFMHSEAFGYSARMLMDIDFVSTKNSNEIHFVIVDGVFKSMKGVIILKDFEHRGTEVNFLARYQYEKLLIPSFFVEFGLEVVIQKVAVRFRNFIEEKGKKNG